MTIPTTVNFSTSTISGQLQLNARAVEQITVPASSTALVLPLPVGLSTATFVAISSLNVQDLTVQFSTVSGATILPVPPGTTVMVYSVTAIYVNSVSGGAIQLAVG